MSSRRGNVSIRYGGRRDADASPRAAGGLRANGTRAAAPAEHETLGANVVGACCCATDAATGRDWGAL